MAIYYMRTQLSLRGALLFLVVLSGLALLFFTSLLLRDDHNAGRGSSSDIMVHGALSNNKHQGLQNRLRLSDVSLRGLKGQHELLMRSSKLSPLGADGGRLPGRTGAVPSSLGADNNGRLPGKTGGGVVGGGGGIGRRRDGTLPGKTGGRLPGKTGGKLPGKDDTGRSPLGGRRSSQDLSIGHRRHSSDVYAGLTRKAGSAATECRDVLCTNYLTGSALTDFYRCQNSASKRYQRFLEHRRSFNATNTSSNSSSSGGILATGNCRFMNGEGRGLVGLVSFPGSGNTWVRGLLQEATGICTGAVYCDAVLRHSGFDGEGIQSPSVLVIKSHSVTPSWSGRPRHNRTKDKTPFDSVILIIRNPFHALVSEWNRLLGTKFAPRGNKTGLSHLESHGPGSFKGNTKWKQFVSAHMKRWSSSLDWLVRWPEGHKVLVVYYEDLVANRIGEVKRMLDFLSFSITDEELSWKLKKEVQLFRRPKGKEFEHYTPLQRQQINLQIHSTSVALQKATGSSYRLEKYLWSHPEGR